MSEICDYSFEGCRALKNLYIDCTTPPILGNNAFFNTTVENRGTLYVPAGTKTLYSEADCWQYFRNIVERGGTNVNTTECKYNIKFSGDYLKFDGLPQNTIIEIYSLQGKLLNKFISNGDSIVFVEDDLVIVKIGNKTMKIAKQSSI